MMRYWLLAAIILMASWYNIGITKGTIGEGLTTRYDSVFARYAGDVPVPFVRALAWGESRFNPRESTGGDWGILQVNWSQVLPTYNRWHGTRYTKQDLLKPDVNAKIALFVINFIIKQYKQNYPNVANMRPNFNNPEFVKLLLAGWNSGYSQTAGVQRVVSHLVRHRIPVTHDNVFAHAKAAGATKWLQSNIRKNWQRNVAAMYRREARLSKPISTIEPTRTNGRLALALGALAAVIILLVERKVYR